MSTKHTEAVLEELLATFSGQHAWITSVAAAAIVQKAIGNLSLAPDAAIAPVPSLTNEQLSTLMTMDFDGKVIKQVNFKRNDVRRIVRQAFSLASQPKPATGEQA